MLVLSLCLSTFLNLGYRAPHLAGGDLDPEELHPLIWGSVLVLLKFVQDVVSAQRAGRAAVPVHFPTRAAKHGLCHSREAAAQLTRVKETLEAALVTWHIEIAVLKSGYEGKIQRLLKGKLIASSLQRVFMGSTQGLCCITLLKLSTTL